MFSAVNNSLSHIFNTSNRVVTMLPSDHKCGENNCSGSKYAGCNLVCYQCLNPKYIECISDRAEIVELLRVLNIEPNQQVSQLIASENSKRIRELFGTESLLKFICPACESEGSFFEIKKKFEEKIKQLQNKNTELRKTLKNEQEKNNEKKDKPVDMANRNDNLNNETEPLSSVENGETNGIYDDLIKTNESLQNEIELLKSKLMSDCNKCDELGQIFISIDTFATEISDTLDVLNYNCKQFKKCIEKNSHGINDQVRSLKLCIPHRNIDNQKTDKKKENTLGRNSGLNPDSNAFQPMENISGANKNKTKVSHKKSNAKKDENGNFNAPKMNANETSKTENLLNVYVGPFEPHIVCNDIASHIVSKNVVKDRRLFNVEMLMPQKDQTTPKPYVSFKISTFSDDIYKKILDKDVWAQTNRPVHSKLSHLNP